MKLNHLALKVNDLLLCSGFYETVLKLKSCGDQLDSQGNLRSRWFDLNGSILMIEKSEKKSRAPDEIGWHMIALTIPQTESANWKQILMQNKITIEKESSYSLYFRDPEQNLIALSWFDHKQFNS